MEGRNMQGGNNVCLASFLSVGSLRNGVGLEQLFSTCGSRPNGPTSENTDIYVTFPNSSKITVMK